MVPRQIVRGKTVILPAILKTSNMEIHKIEKLIQSKSDELIEAIRKNVEPSQIDSLETHLSQLKLTRKKMELSDGKPKPFMKEIIKKLRELDMTMYPEEEVKALFGEMGQIPIMSKFLHPQRDSFMRARPYNKAEVTFTRPDQLNYNTKLSSTFQRATIKDQTAFYGCLKKFDGEDIVTKKDGQVVDNRYVASAEAYRSAFEDHNLCEIRRIGYGRWDVTQTMQVISILHEDMLHSPIAALRAMYKDFIKWSKENEVEEEAVLLSNYLAECFSNADAGKGKEYLYLVSALFSNLCYHQPSIDGVMYPSVRTEKDGICIALSVGAANTKMKLTAAGEEIIYKYKKNSFLNPYKFCRVPEGATSYTMETIPEYTVPDEKIKEILQISSFDGFVDNR